jgi:predicted Zn-dependent protease
MILNETDAKRLLEKMLSYSKADSISFYLTGSNNYNLRFAVNTLSTNGYGDGLTVYLTSNFGKKSGSVSLNRFDESDIKEAVKRSESLARISPENEEFMPPLPAQKYLPSNNYSEGTENLSSDTRAEDVAGMINKATQNDVTSAGYFENEVNFTALTNSNGLFAYNKGTNVLFSSTVRTKDGTGSSKVDKNYVDINNLNVNKLIDQVIDKSIKSANPQELKPGKYTVILEPGAAADLVTYALYFMDARYADEGRSFFSRKGGGNLIGDKLADSKVNIYSDPTDINAPSIPFDGEGYPRNKTAWFENGVLRNLVRGRYWAHKTSQPVVPFPSNLIMKGTETSVDEMIKNSEYAVLVTRFWYIRTVDNQTALVTGLTRDGVFEIVDGKISRPVKNFRFNESPINVLSNVLEIGRAEKASGAETGGFQIFVPVLKVKDFNFSSLSDAI